MKKKAILFTITTILLLLSLFMIASNYPGRIKSTEKTLLLSKAGEQIQYATSDITDNILEDLYSIKLEKIYTNITNIKMNWSGGILSSSLNHKAIAQNYITFVENNYSRLTNLIITLDSFMPGFEISPYGSVYLINQTILQFTTTNTSLLKKIRIDIIINVPIEQVNSSSTPADNGKNSIEVNILDQNQNPILADNSALLNDSLSNLPFFVKTNTGNITIHYGDFLGKPGTLLIHVSNLNATISLFEVTYTNINITPEIYDGNISLISLASGIQKNSRIILN